MGVTLVTERADVAVGLAVTVALAEAKVAELQELPVLCPALHRLGRCQTRLKTGGIMTLTWAVDGNLHSL